MASEPAAERLPQAWYQRRERGSALGLRVAFWLYRRGGRRVAAALLYPIAVYFAATDRALRRASLDYLGRAARAGARGLEGRRAPGWRAVFRHCHEFGRQILDRVGCWMDPHSLAVDVPGMAELDRVAREGRGALVLGAHLGSFDALRLIAQLRSPIAVNVVMYTRHAARINALLDWLANSSRQPGPAVRVLAVPVVADGGARAALHVLEMRKRIAQGEVVALLADRIHPGERGRVVRAEFFGEPVEWPQGPWLLASALGCPVLLMTALRCGAQHYTVHVERLADRIALPRAGRAAEVAGWCRRYAAHLERHCLGAPYQWFNFYPFWDEGNAVVRR